MNWPNDADGDVFRRLQSQGFEFGKQYLIDFSVDFERWPPANEALELLRKTFPSTKTYEPDDEGCGYVKFQLYVRPTYALVKRVQAEVSGLMAPFGGICDSWGILH